MRGGAVSISCGVMGVVSAKIEFRPSSVEVSEPLRKIRTLIIIVSSQIEKKTDASGQTIAVFLTVWDASAYSRPDAQTKAGVLEERIPWTAFRRVGRIVPT